MLRAVPSHLFEYTTTMNAALCVLPDNRTAAYFTYASFPAATISRRVYVATSSDGGRTFAPAVPQPGPAPWYAAVLSAAISVYEVPQCLALPDGSASLMWQAYPLGLRSGRAIWNTSSATFDWPHSTAELAVVDEADDGGINRPPLRLRNGRLFHIGAGADMPGASCKGIGMMGAYSDDLGKSWQHSATNLSVPHTTTSLTCGAG
jgi:hypothetical protein